MTFETFRSTPPTARHSAFTLIEMLVATSVLALIALFITQIISMSSNSIAANSKKLDAVADGRFALDRIGSDLAARLKRTDVPTRFQKESFNDKIAFYAEVPGYSGTRDSSLVEYRVPTTGSTKYQLERGVSAIGWTGNPEIAFQASTLPQLADADFDLISSGILRLEFCFMMDSGRIETSFTDWKSVKAIIVAVAALDPASRKMLSDTDLEVIAESLPDPLDNQTPIAAWQSEINKPGFAGDVPQKAKQGIRLFQRFYEVR